MAELHHAVTCQLDSHFPHGLTCMQTASTCRLTATTVSMAESYHAVTCQLDSKLSESASQSVDQRVHD